MTRMLASVNSVQEALEVLAAQADIIDLKQPAQGALGALPVALVKEIVNAVNGQRPVSATIGDLPMQPDLIFNAVNEMANTGVDYIKIGFFPGGDWLGCIEKLATLTAAYALIAVLFADNQPDFALVQTLKAAGFAGVMLDTMHKSNGSLTHVMNAAKLTQFISLAKEHDLLCGLAGSLKLAEIPNLLTYHADYLGFRGALCDQQNRTAALSPSATRAIRLAIN